MAASADITLVLSSVYAIRKDNKTFFETSDFEEALKTIDQFDAISVIIEDVALTFYTLEARTFWGLFRLPSILCAIPSRVHPYRYAICTTVIDLGAIKNPIKSISIPRLEQSCAALPSGPSGWYGVFTSHLIIFKDDLPLLERKKTDAPETPFLQETKQYLYRMGFTEEDGLTMLEPSSNPARLYFFNRRLWLYRIKRLVDNIFWPINMICLLAIAIFARDMLHECSAYHFQEREQKARHQQLMDILDIVIKLESHPLNQGAAESMTFDGKNFIIKTNKHFAKERAFTHPRYRLNISKNGTLSFHFS